jgi:DNA-binding protein H-NS
VLPDESDFAKADVRAVQRDEGGGNCGFSLCRVDSDIDRQYLRDEDMANYGPRLSSLSIEALVKLRDDVSGVLSAKTIELRSQLRRLEGITVRGMSGRGGRRQHPSKGTKLAPKYRGPDGETWAGRGARPRWLQALLKQGGSLNDFLSTEAAGSEQGKTKPARKAGRKKPRGRRAKCA